MRTPTSSLRRLGALALAALAAQALSGCASLPPLVLLGKPGAVAPAGPKVATLVANLKCELWEAAHSTEVLPYYRDQLPLTEHARVADAARQFTLSNLFQEIEYVGEATLTLDVVSADGMSPSNTLSQYYRSGQGLYPATGATLAVGAQLTDNAHRSLTFDSSIDFSRLIEAEPNPRAERPMRLKLGAAPPQRCDSGGELAGALGLKETLATAMIAAAMNDVAVFPPQSNAELMAASAAPAGAGPMTTLPAAGPIALPATYTYGQISTQVDFTIVKGLSGGPNWSLRYYKGPGGSGSGLLSYQRQIKDTLAITFVPVCVRDKYAPTNRSAPFQYSPPLVEGTPGWASYLPQCGKDDDAVNRVNALSKAKSNNLQMTLQNSLAP